MNTPRTDIVSIREGFDYLDREIIDVITQEDLKLLDHKMRANHDFLTDTDIESALAELYSQADDQAIGQEVLGGKATNLRLKALEGKIFLIDTDSIQFNPQQPREIFDKEHMNRLMANIALAHTQITPILVIPHVTEEGSINFLIVEGERRFTVMSKLCGYVAAQIIWGKDEEEIFRTSFFANYARSEHTPMETAKSLNRLVEYYQEKEECNKTKAIEIIGQLVNLEPASLNYYLWLINLPPKLQEYLNTRQISPAQLQRIFNKLKVTGRGDSEKAQRLHEELYRIASQEITKLIKAKTEQRRERATTLPTIRQQVRTPIKLSNSDIPQIRQAIIQTILGSKKEANKAIGIERIQKVQKRITDLITEATKLIEHDNHTSFAEEQRTADLLEQIEKLQALIPQLVERLTK